MDRVLSKIDAHFSKRSELYNDEKSWVYNEKIIESIISLAKKNCKQNSMIRYADMGAGTCIISDILAENIGADTQVFAIDINSKMLEKGVNNRVVKVISSIENLPFLDSYFHAIISRQCLHYIKDIDRALEEITRVVQPGGRFILSQIVPVDSNTRDYWSKIVKVRQPLRQHYYDELMWEERILQHGYSLEASQKFVTRSSYVDWIKKYRITDNKVSETMKALFINASEEYKIKYHIDFTDNDIVYNSNWFVKSFLRN